MVVDLTLRHRDTIHTKYEEGRNPTTTMMRPRSGNNHQASMCDSSNNLMATTTLANIDEHVRAIGIWIASMRIGMVEFINATSMWMECD